MSVSIEVQTGWRRPHPKAICQDMAALEAVTVYSYDLQAPGFAAYLRSRTGYDLEDAPGSLERHVAMDGLSDEAYSSWHRAEDRPAVLRERRLSRGKFEDAWQLWRKEKRQIIEAGGGGVDDDRRTGEMAVSAAVALSEFGQAVREVANLEQGLLEIDRCEREAEDE